MGRIQQEFRYMFPKKSSHLFGILYHSRRQQAHLYRSRCVKRSTALSIYWILRLLAFFFFFFFFFFTVIYYIKRYVTAFLQLQRPKGLLIINTEDIPLEKITRDFTK